MKKTKTAKAFAIFALLWIILSIVWTWILVLTSGENTGNYPSETLTQDKLQEILNNSTVETTVKVWTGETK